MLAPITIACRPRWAMAPSLPERDIANARCARRPRVSGFFVLSAFYMTWRAWNWPECWRSATIYPLTVHLWGVSLPMLITRFLHAGDAFADVHIWGRHSSCLQQVTR